jgi:hypothetical protein
LFSLFVPSSARALGKRKNSSWIPAFAGMTGKDEGKRSEEWLVPQISTEALPNHGLRLGTTEKCIVPRHYRKNGVRPGTTESRPHPTFSLEGKG